MPRDTELILIRNSNIKQRYHELSQKHSKWKNSAVVQEVAKEFWLTARTIMAILNNEGTYGNRIDDK